MSLGSMKSKAPPTPKREGIEARRERQIRQLFDAIQPAAVEIGAVRPITLEEAVEMDRKRAERGLDSRYTARRDDGSLKLRQATRGHWHKRELHESADAILRRAKDLARRNATESAAIYVRVAMPGEMHPGVFLVDDLDAEALEEIASSGLEPCAVVRTSPDNHQAWIRLSDEPLAAGRAQIVGGYLNELFGDSRASNAAQPGRLPGFTNRKPEHEESGGRFPFVSLLRAQRRTATAGAEWMEAALDNAASQGVAVPPPVEVKTPERKRERALSGEAKAVGELRATDDENMDALCASARAHRAAQVQSGQVAGDLHTGSEWQFLAALWAFRQGIDCDRIERWLEASMRLDKAGTDYAARTAANAWSCYQDPQAFHARAEGSRFKARADGATHFEKRSP